MGRPIKAILHTNNLASNLHQITSSVRNYPKNTNKTIKTLAVVKANAYGHGLGAAIEGFADADGLGLIDLVDAEVLRKKGNTQEILLLEGFFHKQDIDVLLEGGIYTALHSPYQIAYLKERLSEVAKESIAKDLKKINLFIKFNTGMNRLGFKPSEAHEIYDQIKTLKSTGLIGTVGTMMHFANADSDDHEVQVHTIVDDFKKNCLEFEGRKVPVSICNSAACMRFPELASISGTNWIRPGCVLYGSQYFDYRDSEFTKLDLKPGMSLVADVIAIQNLKVGDSVGYGSKFTATKPSKIAIIACGYADGYPRSADNNTEVGVLGKRAKLAGRVSMDMIAIDVTHIPEVNIGTPVVLWGEGGPSIDEVAKMSGRIAYELMCGIAPRVPKGIANGQA